MSVSVEQEIRTLRTHFWSDRDPEGRAFAPLADAYRRKGDLSEAESLLRDGLGRLPDFATGRLVSALVKRDQGQLDEAMSELDRLLELDSRNVLALAERAGVSLLLGDRESAIQDANQALELEPGHEGAQAVLEQAEGGAPAAEAGDPAAAASTFDLEAGDPAAAAAFELEPEAQVLEPEAQMEEEASFGIEEAMDEPGDGAATRDPETAETSGFQLDPEALEVEDDDPLGGLEGPDVELDWDDEAADEAPAAALDDQGFGGFELSTEPESPGEPEPSPQAPASPSAPGTPGKVYTRTLGDLYARQGFFQKAVEVYEHLVQRSPDDPELSSRLTELREKASQADPEGVDAPAPAGSEAKAAPQEPEDRAPQWMEAGAGEVGDDTESAFSWSGADEEEEVGAASGRPIAGYLKDLMAWVPGAVPIHSLAPEDATPVPIASLAPDGGNPDGAATDGGAGV